MRTWRCKHCSLIVQALAEFVGHRCSEARNRFIWFDVVPDEASGEARERAQ